MFQWPRFFQAFAADKSFIAQCVRPATDQKYTKINCMYKDTACKEKLKTNNNILSLIRLKNRLYCPDALCTFFHLMQVSLSELSSLAQASIKEQRISALLHACTSNHIY